MNEIVVLYDGWELAYLPNQPAAIYLSLLWDYLPRQVRPAVALPAHAFDLLPERVDQVMLETPPTPRGRFHWEQRLLNQLAKKTAAQVIHLTSGGPTIFKNIQQVLSPAGYLFSAELGGGAPEIQPPATQRGLATRLREALLPFNLERSRRLIWPADLPEPQIDAPFIKLPAILPSSTWQDSDVEVEHLDLPESFILYHGPTSDYELHRLLDAWSWAAPAVSQYYPLVLVGLNPGAQQRLADLAGEYQLQDTLRGLPEIPVAALLEVYRRSKALFHPGLVSPWGDSLTLALFFNKPIVALENRWSDQRLGPAAYLIQQGDSLKTTSRLLGAALVTVIVEDDVADRLAKQAGMCSSSWRASAEKLPELLISSYTKR